MTERGVVELTEWTWSQVVELIERFPAAEVTNGAMFACTQFNLMGFDKL